jgi:hypothetical protein
MPILYHVWEGDVMSETTSAVQQCKEWHSVPEHNPDEINLLEYIYVLIKNKWWIIGFTLLAIAGGHIAAIVKGPTWTAEAIIAPKENETQKSPSLSALGAFGGLVASQLNMGGNASLEKIELLLDSRDFNARLVEKYNLLPEIYRILSPKEFEQIWDSTTGKWIPTFNKPEKLATGEILKGTFLKKKPGQSNNTLKIEIHSRDSTFSLHLAKYYLEFLDEDIKFSTRNDARGNVDFLENQLITISDPLLREKIQSLMADEIEKTMVVSKEAFKVIDPVYLSKTFKERKIYPLLFAAVMFFLTVLTIVLIHAFTSANKTEEDRRLLLLIKSSLLPMRK